MTTKKKVKKSPSPMFATREELDKLQRDNTSLGQRLEICIIAINRVSADHEQLKKAPSFAPLSVRLGDVEKQVKGVDGCVTRLLKRVERLEDYEGPQYPTDGDEVRDFEQAPHDDPLNKWVEKGELTLIDLLRPGQWVDLPNLKVIEIKNMTDAHLFNAIRHLLRHKTRFDKVDEMVNELYGRIGKSANVV